MYKFEKLTVWQEAIKLSQACYVLVRKLPTYEQYGLADQLRRAVTSIALNIAEGSGSNTDKEFLRYLYIAKKSLFEVLSILKLIEKMYQQLKVEEIYLQIDSISKMLEGLIKKLKTSS